MYLHTNLSQIKQNLVHINFIIQVDDTSWENILRLMISNTNFIYYNYESVHDLSHITKNTHLLSLIDLDKDHIILTL